MKKLLAALSFSLLATAGCSHGIKFDSDYESKSIATFHRMADVFAGAGKDCHKLAKDLNAFLSDNEKDLKAISAYEDAHKESTKKIEDKHPEVKADFMTKAGPGLEACKDDKDVQKALEKMPH